MAENERIAQETISELRNLLEQSSETIETLEITLQNMKNDYNVLSNKHRQLELFLGPEGTSPLGVKNAKGDDSDGSEDTACSSFVVVSDSGVGSGSARDGGKGVGRMKRGSKDSTDAKSLEHSMKEREEKDEREEREETEREDREIRDSMSGSGSDALLSAQASLVLELQDRYKEAMEEVNNVEILLYAHWK